MTWKLETWKSYLGVTGLLVDDYAKLERWVDNPKIVLTCEMRTGVRHRWGE